MSIVTISAIKADIGGYVGHSAGHPDLLSQAQRRVGEAVAEGLLIDGAVNSCGDDVNLVMTHRHGVDAEPVHHFAWDTFVELTEVAKRLHLYGAGQDLLADAFSGNVRGAGPGVAELTGERWRALFSEGVQEVWITDTVLSRRRPPQAHIVPVAPLLARVLEEGSDPRRF